MSVSSSHRARRWRTGFAVVAAAALAVVGLTAAPANAEAPPVSISPTSASPGVVQSFTVTVAGTATSTAAQTVSITVPTGFATPSLDPSWTKPGSNWTVAGPTGSTWTFTGTNSQKLNAGKQLVATFSAVTPGAGTYTWSVSGTTNGTTAIADITSPTVTIGVVKQAQTITFDSIADQTYGTGPLTMTASASSGLAVAYTATGTCWVAGTSLTLSTAGTCSVTAHQAGDSSYFAATDVTRTFEIDKAGQTITFDPIGNQDYGTGPLTLTATGGASGNPVTFTVNGHCSVAGTSLSLDSAGPCDVTAHQDGDANYLDATAVTRSFAINQAHAVLTLSGLTHTYDGLQHGATVTTDPDGLTGVGITYDGSATEPSDAGEYSVEATLENANYEATPVTNTLVIGKKPVTGTFTVADKEYDGSAAATVTDCSVHGIEAGDSVTLDCSAATAVFNGAGAGSHTATLTGAVLTGADAQNYDLTSVGTANGTIDKKTVTATLQAGDKIYDGGDTASATAVLDGVLGADLSKVDAVVDAAHFADEAVGTGKTVTATVHLTGSAAGNYALASPTVTAQASINALHISGSFTASDKVYDGVTGATVLTRGLSGEVPGDDVALSGGTATFDDKNVGPAKTVTLAGASLAGTRAGNYMLDSVDTTTAAITQLTIGGSFTAADKVWDGTTAATITDRVLTGAVSGDDVSLSGGVATFADANVGIHKAVTVPASGSNAFALSGGDAGNYTLAAGPWTAYASISAAYSFKGFYQPVDMTPAGSSTLTYNSVKGGATVPIKFEVFATGTNGPEQTDLSVFGTGAFKVSTVTCKTSNVLVDSIEVTNSGSTSLRYDTTGGQYIQNWKTPTSPNTCYAVSMTTKDGTTLGPAYFQVTK